MWLILLFITAVTLLYIHFNKTYNYWSRRNVPTAEHVWIFGNMYEAFFARKNMGMIVSELYSKYNKNKYVGIYNYATPTLLIRDPQLIKDVVIKDFNSFHDNNVIWDLENDFLFANNPFAIKGEQWKVVRAQITPSFTSGKMKEMFALVKENCNKMLAYIERNHTLTFEAKELAGRFTGENVAGCAFGLDGQCFQRDDAEFYHIGKSLMEPTRWMAVNLVIGFLLPSYFSRRFKKKLFNDDAQAFLHNIVEQTLAYRKANNVKRGDFLDEMYSLRERINNDGEFNIRHIVAHASGFFADGFETSSIVISFALYALAINPRIQEQLRDEILADDLSYDALMDNELLDCVIKETMRMHSPAYILNKLCTKRYKLLDGDDDAYVEPGTAIVLPIHAVHMDEKYFPQPDTFKPERFAKENVGNIVKCTYMPFGDGPRMCLGSKFGMLQAKLAVATILTKYRIHINPKTPVPIKLNPKSSLLYSLDGIWLNFDKLVVGN